MVKAPFPMFRSMPTVNSGPLTAAMSFSPSVPAESPFWVTMTPLS